MDIYNRVFKVSGEKIESLMVGNDSLKMLSKAYTNPNEFEETWGKSLTLVTKNEIKFDSIKRITQEEGDEEVKVHYKGSMGMSLSVGLTFASSDDREAVLRFFEEKMHYSRSSVQLSPMKSAMPSVWGLVISLAGTIFMYWTAAKVASGGHLHNADDYSRTARRGRTLESIASTLGTTGVLLIGGLITAIVGYMLYQRFKNPPTETRLEPKP
jgi:hypothetical protein